MHWILKRLSEGCRGIGLLAILLAVGCSSEPHGNFGGPEDPPPPVDPDALCLEAGATRCTGLDFETCVEGRWHRLETCTAPTPFCHPEAGCGECEPNTRFCAAREIYLCDAVGTSAELVESCTSGQECLFGECYDACGIAESRNSYLGCRFMAVATANLLSPEFTGDFAVVVTNPSS